MANHKELTVWKKSMDFVIDIYNLAKVFPKEEMFNLTSQIKRSAVSIPSNIAEGAGRQSKTECIRFLYISLGSASELETQLEIAYRLGFVQQIDEHQNKIRHIKSMLPKLIKSLGQTD